MNFYSTHVLEISEFVCVDHTKKQFHHNFCTNMQKEISRMANATIKSIKMMHILDRSSISPCMKDCICTEQIIIQCEYENLHRLATPKMVS